MDVERLRALLDLIPVGIIAADREGRVVYSNRAALTGYDVDVGELPLDRALRGESCDDVEIFVEERGIHLNAAARPWLDEHGATIGGIVVFYESSARVFLDSIIENVPNMIFVKEAGELRFERFNRAGEELLGKSRGELIGKNDYDFFPKEQADHFQKLDKETLRGGTMVDIAEEPIQTARGQRWLHTKKVPILDRHGRPKYLLGISEDITERKAAQEELSRTHDELERRVIERTAELQRANEELRQAQKMEAIGVLAGGVAHDFNNMLSVILSCAELIEYAAPESAPWRDDLAQIISAGRRAASLTQKLLAFSRRQVLQPTLLDLGEVLHNLEDMLQRLIGEDIELRTIRRDRLSSVLADRGQIEQAIMNLAVNARDAMEGGGVLTIAAGDVELTEPATPLGLAAGTYVELEVNDTGIGMSREVMSRVFEPFFTTKPAGKGTGLGLSTVFGIIKQSGGDISVESRIGGGTTFHVYLPRAEGRRLEEAAILGTTAPGGADTLLLVEDEPLVRSTAVRVLRMRGYRVLEAGGAAEALELARDQQERIDLLLTDVVMPGMNGRELADHIRAMRPAIRVIFMSGYTDDVIVRHGIHRAQVAFIAKPFTPDALARKVRAVLDASRSVT